MNTKAKTILESKRFWAAVAGVISALLIGAFPELITYDTLIIDLIQVSVGLLIAGYTLQDVAKEVWQRPDVQEVVKDKEVQAYIQQAVINALKEIGAIK